MGHGPEMPRPDNHHDELNNEFDHDYADYDNTTNYYYDYDRPVYHHHHTDHYLVLYHCHDDIEFRSPFYDNKPAVHDHNLDSACYDNHA